MDEKIFQEEQKHLTDTYRKLEAMRDALQERIDTISERAAAEKKDIRSNLSLNFDSDTDTMETYIEFEAMSHAIDQYNIERDSAVEKLGRVKRLLAAPYFARVTLQFDPEEEPEDYYIGSAGISENAWEHLVIDWRSPIAETYYNQDNGRTFYEVDGRKIDVDLLLRRQFNLEKNRLRSYFDTQVAIEDPLLLQSLASRRSDKMQAITATIQKEQNAVIRYGNVPVLLVNGIAGSGKTSVLLQRIAYLFYRQREKLRPEQVYLLTLNPVFRQYIDHVLPDLGEENPHTITWQDFIAMVGVPMYVVTPEKSDGHGREAAPEKPDGRGREAAPEKPDGRGREAAPGKPDGRGREAAPGRGGERVWRGYGYETKAENLLRIEQAMDSDASAVRSIRVSGGNDTARGTSSSLVGGREETASSGAGASSSLIGGNGKTASSGTGVIAVQGGERRNREFSKRMSTGNSLTAHSTIMPSEEKLVLEREDFRPIYQKGIRVLSVQDIADAAAELSHIPVGPRFVQILIDLLKERAKRAVRQFEREPEGGRRAEAGRNRRRAGGNWQASNWQETKENESENALDAEDFSEGSRESNRITNQYGGAFRAIETCAWLDFERIGCRILHKKMLTATEWFYLKMALTGEFDRNARYVMIDEVQDYTPAQLMTIRKYFVNAKFMMLGDEFQAIRPGTVTFAQIHELFGEDQGAGRGIGLGAGRDADRDIVRDADQDAALETNRGASQGADRGTVTLGAGTPATRGTTSAGGKQRAVAKKRYGGTSGFERKNGKQKVVELPLMTSYRSSPEITELFTSLLPPERQVMISSVQRPGTKPKILICESAQCYAAKLRKAVRDAQDSDVGLTAIICGNRRSLEKVRKILLQPEESVESICGSETVSECEFGNRTSRGQTAGEKTFGEQISKEQSATVTMSAETLRIKVLRKDEALPESGVVLMTLDLAKGLEFNSVIIPDADEKMYPEEVLSRHRLYTAISRATQRLTILAEGELTPLLRQQ